MHIECYNCPKKGNYNRGLPKKNNGPHHNTRIDINRFNDQRRRGDQRNDRNGIDERKKRHAPSDHDDDRRPQKSQDSPGMKVMLQINMNILLFMPL